MVIYNKPVCGLMPEMIAELAPKHGHVFSKQAAIDWFAQRYPKIKRGTVSAHLIRFSTNAPSRLHYHARPTEDLLYQLDGGHFRVYDPATDPSPLHSKSDAATVQPRVGKPIPNPLSDSGGGRGVDIERNLQAYLGAREPGARYTSFDYCFNYFQSHHEQGRLPELLRGEALQLSCLHLGFYLASWGMLRGSSELLQKSVRHLVPLVEVIASSPAAMWKIDAHMYGDGSCQAIFYVAGQIRAALPGASDILVTKIMLGTFGCVPAFDTYFKKGFGVSTFGPGALRKVGEFYEAKAEVIERNRVHTLDFESGQTTERRYTRAKVIDMIFFVAGGS